MNEPNKTIDVETTTAVAKTESSPPPLVAAGSSVLDLEPAAFSAGLDRRKQNRNTLLEWIKSSLVEGTDYGKIHVVARSKCAAGNDCANPRHWSKPCLFKPGAEKITGMLGVRALFPSYTEYEQAALKGVRIVSIIIRCQLVNNAGTVLAEGIGARGVETDYGDINKSLKMAAKSAMIYATLNMAGLSEIFTLDIEDMVAAGRVFQPADGKVVDETAEEKKERWIEHIGDDRESAVRYYREQGKLTPHETLHDLKVSDVPRTKREADSLKLYFKTRSNPPAAPADTDNLEFMDMIVPIPPKGVKRDDYLKSPDTIGSLYEASKTDEAARKRLWGFVEHFEPQETWTNSQGRVIRCSPTAIAAERQFRAALDAFKHWRETSDVPS